MTMKDADALCDAVQHANSFDLYRRFMGRPPPPHVLTKLLGAADGVNDALLGAFGIDGRLVGVAQFDRAEQQPSAELAIEVATDWQRCGLGRVMLRELAVMAAACGITVLTAVYFTDNVPLISLLQSTGASTWMGATSVESTAQLDVGRLLLPAAIARVQPTGA
jgi:GNAT superfamily N-acetyltransferase